jgi:transcriptional regulator with XRE-family HTH domain
MMEFNEWLLSEIRRRGWPEAEFARRGKISPQAVNQTINGINKPGIKMLEATARAFDLPLEEVMRRSGRLRAWPAEAITDDLLERLRRLPAEDQDKVLALWRLSLETLETLRGLAPPA